jgi:DNA-binding NarL/FixJ family response regulator
MVGEQSSGRRLRRVRVLLVEDEPDFRMLLRHRLRSDDRFELVGEAADGKEAVSLAVEHQPDVVVMDLGLPGMDGLEAMGRIRHQAPGTKCVVLSSYDARSLGQRAAERGAYAYLQKGMAVQQILTVLAPLAPPEFA